LSVFLTFLLFCILFFFAILSSFISCNSVFCPIFAVCLRNVSTIQLFAFLCRSVLFIPTLFFTVFRTSLLFCILLFAFCYSVIFIPNYSISFFVLQLCCLLHYFCRVSFKFFTIHILHFVRFCYSVIFYYSVSFLILQLRDLSNSIPILYFVSLYYSVYAAF
jgi:hypothetical protein